MFFFLENIILIKSFVYIFQLPCNNPYGFIYRYSMIAIKTPFPFGKNLPVHYNWDKAGINEDAQ